MAPQSLRPARPEDASGVRALFEAVHRRPLPGELHRWRYDGRPDAPCVATVAEEDGRVVAHLGALTFELETPAGRRRAGLWADLMVHPERRGLPLFLDLAEANTAACAEAGLSLLYAFPNDNSWPLLKRLLGWTDLGDLAAFEGPLPEAPEAPAALPGLPEAAELDEFWERVRPPAVVGLRRSGAWARWRYAQRPTERYREEVPPPRPWERPAEPYRCWQARGESGALRGWAAAKVYAGPGRSLGDILDLWAENSDAEDRLLAAALGYFAREGVDAVSAWAARGDQQGSLWTSLGLEPDGPRTHFGARALTPEARGFTDDPTLWRITKGDSDVF